MAAKIRILNGLWDLKSPPLDKICDFTRFAFFIVQI
jgi:hypothetical protein